MHSDARFGFLPQRGEMAQRIKAFDWSATALGEPEHWPQNLRTSLSLCLSSRFPIIIWWGPDMRLLYNDAYIPFLGANKHPSALAQPGAECWREIWDDIGPMLQGVYATGEATWSQDKQFFFARELPREEVYVTFTYGPILAADGQTVDGIFCPCTETTGHILGARRIETLRQLGLRSHDTRTVEDASRKICDLLAASSLDVPFALIYQHHHERKGFELLASTGVANPQALSADLWPLQEVLQTQEASNVTLHHPALQIPARPWPEFAQSARLVPLHWSGNRQADGVMVLGISPRRPLDAGYTSFLDLVAGHTAALAQEAWRVEAQAALDRAKTVFFSNISHEFRTPLTLMLGPLEDALREHGGQLPPSQATMLHRNALRLQKLVNTLLDFSRLEAGRMEGNFQPVDLQQLTEELSSSFRSAIEAAGLQYEVHCAPLTEPVFVDRDMYEKIVLNLLSNAFKFTLTGQIEVRLHELDDVVQLQVADTGSGIPAAQLSRVFERFHRIAGQAARTHEGTGIGLSLVRELLHMHGGEINVQSRPGYGSVFTVTLRKGSAHLPPEFVGKSRPLAPSSLRDEHYLEEALRWLPTPNHAIAQGHNGDIAVDAGALNTTPAALRTRVLCADDNADMRDYLAHLLSPFHVVETVADGLQALEVIRLRPPDLVITDVMMPGLDGFGLLQTLRNDERTRALPVLMLSARAGEEAQIEGIHAGADDYLIKPFSSRELLARVTTQLRLANLREQTHARLRANEKQLRAIIEQLPAGVGVSDLQGKWMLSNTMMDRFAPSAIPSTVPNPEDRWCAWDEAGHPVPPDNWPSKRALRGELVVPGVEMLYRPDSGKPIWMRVSAAPLRDDAGNLVGTCSVMQDINQLKLAEQQLKEADRRKDEFLAVLAHELRNPLAPITSSLDMLRMASPELEKSPKARHSHAVLERQVAHLTRLVDELFDISRITAGKIQLVKQPLEFAQVVEQAVDASRHAIESCGLSIRVTLPPRSVHLDADPVRLTQVIVNLLNNATKYTPEGGEITVTAQVQVKAQVQATGDNASLAVLSIKDNGIGIPQSMLPRIFDMFTQVEPRNRVNKDGLGIGLSLAKTLMELHGGSIEAISAGPGLGSEFVIRLPLSRTPGLPNDAPEHAAHSAENQRSPLGRVLIVDDNRDAADVLSMVLDDMGAQTQVTHDGATALEMARAHPPETILLDLGLPGMSGIEVAKQLRSDPRFKHTVIIAVTGWAPNQKRELSTDGHFDHHLVKPVKAHALEQLLRTLRAKKTSG